MSIKRNILLVILFIGIISCKAQTIVPIYGGSSVEYNENYYLKDVNNDYDKYQGIWKYNGGGLDLTITFFIKQMVQDSDGLYRDFLCGSFLFRSDGILLIEDILEEESNLDFYEYNLVLGRFIDRNFKPQCPSCPIDKLRPMGKIYHPEIEDVSAAIVLYYSVILEPFQETMKLTLWQNSPRIITPDRTDPYDFPIPDGDYIFVKQ